MSTLNIHFFLLNDDFSPEYAEANHQGKESENNTKYEWEDEIDIPNVQSYTILRNNTIPVSGLLPDDSPFEAEFSRMCVIELKTDDGPARIGVSESILDHFHESENRMDFFIKDYEPHGNPLPGVYVASKEFPKQLVL